MNLILKINHFVVMGLSYICVSVFFVNAVIFIYNGDIKRLAFGLVALVIAGLAFAVQSMVLYLWDRDNKFSE